MKFSSATHEICITPPPGRRVYDWVRLENGSMIPRRFTAELAIANLRITLDIEADTDGHSRCLRISGVEPIKPITAVTSIPSIPSLLKAATAFAGSWMVFERGYGAGWEGRGAKDDEAAATVSKQLKTAPSRRRDTPSQRLLREVAETYRAVSAEQNSGVVEEVADRLSRGRSATYELVKGARRAGLLDSSPGAQLSAVEQLDLVD